MLEQRQIGAAAADLVEKVETALPGGVGRRGRRRGIDQARSEGVEALAVARRQLQIAAALTEAVQAFEHRPRLAKAERGQPLQGVVVDRRRVPDTGQRMTPLFGLGEDLLEMPANNPPMRVEGGEKVRPVGMSHRPGDLPALLVTARQPMGLRVADVLQTVLEAAQEIVGGGQLVRALRRQQPPLDEQGEHLQRRPNLQHRLAATANQLEHLGDELDFANPARSQLDVLGHVLARHFAANLRVQIAHGVDRPIVEVFAEDEGTTEGVQRVDPFRLQIDALVHHPRLDPGVTFPFAALGDEIVLERAE